VAGSLNRPEFAAFSTAEHAERLARARSALAEAGIDACVCVAPENLHYLAGFDSITYFSQQALVFSARGEREPTLIVRDVDLPLARETSWVDNVRTYHLHAGAPSVCAHHASARMRARDASAS